MNLMMFFDLCPVASVEVFCTCDALAGGNGNLVFDSGRFSLMGVHSANLADWEAPFHDIVVQAGRTCGSSVRGDGVTTYASCSRMPAFPVGLISLALRHPAPGPRAQPAGFNLCCLVCCLCCSQCCGFC